MKRAEYNEFLYIRSAARRYHKEGRRPIMWHIRVSYSAELKRKIDDLLRGEGFYPCSIGEPSTWRGHRFIFAVFLIKDAYSGDDQDEGTVTADPVWRIELAPGQAERILFWNYYFNERKPEKIVFGSGLHRYLTDIEAAQILRDIASIKGDDFSAAFFTHFCEVNGIDANNLSAPSGALMRQATNTRE